MSLFANLGPVKSESRAPVSAIHGMWVSVFGIEAVVKGDDLGHQLGALILGVLFTALLVTERRSHRREAFNQFDGPTVAELS